MKKISLFLLSVVIASCVQKVPITGRRQVSLVSEREMMSMSFTEYDKFLKANKVLPATDQRVMMVQQIGKRIQTAVESFMKEKGLSSRIEGYKWEFNVVDDPTVNAWCMPGGKVVVYTGLLPVTQDEASLAIVMGHEIAHAVARHGNERMSQGLAVQLGGVALSVALQNKSTQAQNVFLQSYGIGSQLGMLKYSRTHETEADKMGLVFAAMGGYDPNSSIAFWERMAAQSAGQKPPELLSTHPSDETRINDLKAFMPEAMKYYKPQ
ncbi:MAG: Peptidase family [Bacteroidetes bacterium]|jgi:predicted Zn-dependent protease|nr:Peptidase family [Bacteroidota bacterium]